jgi:molecular chaperone GrpE
MKKSDVEIEKQSEETEPAEAADSLVPDDQTPLTSEQLEELKDKAAKADEHWQRLLRTSADFDNFKKRAAREKQDAIKFANESLLQKLIPVLDNFDMALSAAQAAPSDAAESLQTGISMIYQQLKNAAGEAGLEEVDAAGKVFDPNLHEAVSQKESADTPEGSVLQQLRKGYKLRERLLRPASVVVAKKPAA